MDKKDDKNNESKLSKQQIVFIGFICLLIFSMLYSKFKDGHINPSKTITFEEIEETPVTTEEIDYGDYIYSYEEETTESSEESDIDDGSVDDFVDIPSEYAEDIVDEEPVATESEPSNYSKSPAGFYDELNATIEDIAIVKDSNIDIILQGLVMGYISDCMFVTNQFLEVYANGFLPDVQSVEILSKDFNGNTAKIKVNGVDVYNVSFTIMDDAIDSLTLQKVEGE